MSPQDDTLEAAVASCPDCGEDQLHDVLHAPGATGAQHATVRCRECGRVHRALLRPSKLLEVPCIISRGDASERGLVALPDDETLSIGDEIVAAEQLVKVTGIDDLSRRRVRSAMVRDIATLWVIHFEEILVKISVNLDRKTISKAIAVSPHDTFTIGDEFDLDRLRVVIHRIRVEDKTLHHGTAEASEIRRIFAKPKQLAPDERRERRAELGIPEPKVRRRPWGPTRDRKAPPRPPPRTGAEDRPRRKGPGDRRGRTR